jgi:hypothetical protein
LAVLFASICLASWSLPARAQWAADGIGVCLDSACQTNPALVGDGAGGFFVVWQDYRYGFGADLFGMRVTSGGTQLWPQNGQGLVTALYWSDSQQMIPNGAGGMIISFSDGRTGGVYHDIYVAAIGAGGGSLWTYNGVALCTAGDTQLKPVIVTDGANGAIVAWEDYRTGTADIYARRVNSAGTPLWSANGTALCTASGAQWRPQIVSDAAGGAIIAWADLRSGTNRDIYARRIGDTGTPLWSANGVAVCTAPGDQDSVSVVADGAGGAILIWKDRRSGSNWDIYAQRLNSAGTPLWGANGIGVCTAAGDQVSPIAVGDGLGGAIVAWVDRRSGTDSDIYAQRLGSNGDLLWAAAGVAVCSAAGDQFGLGMSSNAGNGSIIVWLDGRSGTGQDVYAQRFSGEGQALWAAAGIPVCTAASLQRSPSVMADGNGGAFVAWEDERSLGANCQDIYVQHISAEGVTGGTDTDGDGLPDAWETDGIPVAGGSSTYVLPGSDPMHKDLYVEVDAMVGQAPANGDLERVVAAFAQSPVSNPDGTQGIRLHVIGTGCDPCVDEADIPAAEWSSPPWTQVHAIKADKFGTPSDRSNPDWASIAEARARATRYCVFGVNFHPNDFSGVCEGVGGDFVVTLGHHTNVVGDQRAGTFMHELGHSLGLRHGGVDDVNFKPNFYSVMNYTWQWPITLDLGGTPRRDLQNYRDSWRLDYSRSRLNELDESGLNEHAGIGGDADRWVPIGPPIGFVRRRVQLVPMGGAVDWSRDGTADDVSVTRDVNFMGQGPNGNASPGELLRPSDDWGRLQYPATEPFALPLPLASIYASADDEIDEMTPAIYDSLSTIELDCNDNDIADHEEIAAGAVADVNDNGIPDPCESPAILVNVGNTATSGGLRLAIAREPDGRAHRISFSLPDGSRTKLRIFDLTGRTIVTLVDGEVAPGTHLVRWDHADGAGGSVSSGIYFVRLQSGSRSVTGRLVVIR